MIKQKINKNYYKIATILLSILAIMLLIIIEIQENQTNNKIEESYNLLGEKTGCNNIYLGFCFDNSSEFYKTDLINKECNAENFAIVSKIKFMEENNIKIYGLSTCSACSQQLSQFGKYKSVLQFKGLFVLCDTMNDVGCNDILYVPTWKQDNKIINIGVMEI